MTSRIPFPDGEGFFETLLTRNGLVADLNRHMRRAVRTSQQLKIPIPQEEELRVKIAEELSSTPHSVGRLRICFRHIGIDISHNEYVPSEEPARVTFAQESLNATGEQWKTFPYTERFTILDEALAWGFDDAIIFNKANEVTETSIANIALRIAGEWVTPPISSGILPGTMRAHAVEDHGVKVRAIHISEIADVEAGLLLSSLKIAQPISHIGDYECAIDNDVTLLSSEIAAKLEFHSVG